LEPAVPEKKAVRVIILNSPYTLLTAGDPAETEALAAEVDELMTQIAARGNMDSTRAAVLAALHLADRLRSLERDVEKLRQRLGEKSRELSLLLDQTVSEA
jgi:cell division protein ZapA (FtsZ GTPase activity inhibitor)